MATMDDVVKKSLAASVGAAVTSLVVRSQCVQSVNKDNEALMSRWLRCYLLQITRTLYIDTAME